MTQIPQIAKFHKIYKQAGETPLEALEKFRTEQKIDKAVPITYAGRLDPMAEGELIILIGDECKNKEKYLGLDKEYEIEIVFGISTDTYDALGLAEIGEEVEISKMARNFSSLDLSKYCGKFNQKYPPYSSKTVGGKQLHNLAREDNLPDEMPTKQVEIYSIEIVENKKISAITLLEYIIPKIDLVHGDFRQDIIKSKWREILGKSNSTNNDFKLLKCRIKCSSGTYMRSLANKIGQDMGIGAFTLTIKRTEIFSKKLANELVE